MENKASKQAPKKALRKTDVIKSACVNCGKPKEEHSSIAQLCPTRFAHFEQAV
jgi:hypothetical protein